MASDMWTGWGIHTLSADHPAFNPYNYQTGSVWPHDNAIIAMGFKFCGFAAEAARIAHDICPTSPCMICASASTSSTSASGAGASASKPRLR